MEVKEFTVHGHKMTVSKVHKPKDKNPFQVSFQLRISDLTTEAKVCFQKEENRNQVFTTSDQALADRMYEEIISGLDFIGGGTSKLFQVPKTSES